MNQFQDREAGQEAEVPARGIVGIHTGIEIIAEEVVAEVGIDLIVIGTMKGNENIVVEAEAEVVVEALIITGEAPAKKIGVVVAAAVVEA